MLSIKFHSSQSFNCLSERSFQVALLSACTFNKGINSSIANLSCGGALSLSCQKRQCLPLLRICPRVWITVTLCLSNSFQSPLQTSFTRYPYSVLWLSAIRTIEYDLCHNCISWTMYFKIKAIYYYYYYHHYLYYYSIYKTWSRITALLQ